MEDCADLREWELVVVTDLSESLKAAEAVNDDSKYGAIKADYFALDSSSRRGCLQSQESSECSEDSDNPNWVDPDCSTRLLEISREQLGFIGSHVVLGNSCGFCSDDSSYEQKSLPGDEKGDSWRMGGSFMEVVSEGSDSRCENSEGENENDNKQEIVDVGGGGGAYDREGGKRGGAWQKMPLQLLKICIFRVMPVWSIPMAVVLVGVVILGRKLYRMKHKSWSIPLRIDMKTSQIAARTAHFNEAFSVVRRMLIVRPPAVSCTHLAVLSP